MEDDVAIPIDQTESATDENIEQSNNLDVYPEGTSSHLMAAQENAYQVA